MPALYCASMVMMMAQGLEDTDGCRDSALLSRKPGCVIESCSRKEFDSAEILLGKANNEERVKTVEGQTEQLQYLCPNGVSGLQIARNVAAALKAAGFQLIFEGKDTYDEHAVTGQKGQAWVSVRTNSEGRYLLTTAIEKQMTQELSAQWAGAIEEQGRVVLEGIQFATGSALILPSSETVLAEVVRLLAEHPDWRIRVEGHTDATGAAAGNQKLSADRARSVVAWLVTHGVDAGRLLAEGFGGSRPVADNATEAGRAKNRRVELARL